MNQTKGLNAFCINKKKKSYVEDSCEGKLSNYNNHVRDRDTESKREKENTILQAFLKI